MEPLGAVGRLGQLQNAEGRLAARLPVDGDQPGLLGRVEAASGIAPRSLIDRKKHAHAPAEAGAPDAPVVHVSWFEADAFARAHEARLPTEIEWEKAATWDQLEGIGRVWEWTESHFAAYPDFVAHPYREYSEVFFGDRYRVLRGGSCATHPRVASLQFRNWDLPERRQLFAGVRIAR